jgi:hypothetical protein
MNYPKSGQLWGSAGLLILVTCVWAYCLSAPAFWRAVGIGGNEVPFLDLYGSLAAGELAHNGGNPFIPNTLDYYNRPHVYTTWWLIIGDWGLTRADTKWLGLLLIGLTLATTVALNRPSQPHEFILTAIFLCSPAILFAINRGNNDLVVFIIMSCALGLFRSNKSVIRLLGFALLAICAVLKYYPFAAIILILSAHTRRESIMALALFTCIIVFSWPSLQPGLISALKYKPSPEGLYAFGAPFLLKNLGDFPPNAWWIIGAITGACAFILAKLRQDTARKPSISSSTENEFICGSVFIVGCFFLGASYLYKLIFSIWLLPWLRGEKQIQRDEYWRRINLGIVLIVLWFEGCMCLMANLVIGFVSVNMAKTVYEITVIWGQVFSWLLILALLTEVIIYTYRRLQFLGSKSERVCDLSAVNS